MDQPSTGFDSDLSIQAASATTWRVIAPLIWTGTQPNPANPIDPETGEHRPDTFIVPVGFLTDFSTSPRFLHWLWLPYGAYTRAAVLHDFLLESLYAWLRLPPVDQLVSARPVTSRDIDGIFRRAMKDLGVPWSKRWLGWTAVRWGALFSSRRSYGRGFARDLPKVLGMSLLALPVILPGAIGVLVSLGMVRVITWVRPPVQHLARRGRLGRPPTKENDHDAR